MSKEITDHLSVSAEATVPYHVGIWSSIATAVLVLAFDSTSIAGMTGADTKTLAVLLSLLIAPCFTILLASIHRIAEPSGRIWTQIGLTFAAIYASLAMVNYFLQLTVVRISPQNYPWLSMEFTSESGFWALEVIIYTFMGLAGACIAPIVGRGLGRAIKWLLFVNATITLVACVAYVLRPNPLNLLVMISLGVWGLALPAVMILIAVQFKRNLRRIR